MSTSMNGLLINNPAPFWLLCYYNSDDGFNISVNVFDVCCYLQEDSANVDSARNT